MSAPETPDSSAGEPPRLSENLLQRAFGFFFVFIASERYGCGIPAHRVDVRSPGSLLQERAPRPSPHGTRFPIGAYKTRVGLLLEISMRCYSYQVYAMTPQDSLGFPIGARAKGWEEGSRLCGRASSSPGLSVGDPLASPRRTGARVKEKTLRIAQAFVWWDAVPGGMEQGGGGFPRGQVRCEDRPGSSGTIPLPPRRPDAFSNTYTNTFTYTFLKPSPSHAFPSGSSKRNMESTASLQ
jgi:hypothetical protein